MTKLTELLGGRASDSPDPMGDADAVLVRLVGRMTDDLVELRG